MRLDQHVNPFVVADGLAGWDGNRKTGLMYPEDSHNPNAILPGRVQRQKGEPSHGGTRLDLGRANAG
jgi:hypothetical protein